MDPRATLVLDSIGALSDIDAATQAVIAKHYKALALKHGISITVVKRSKGGI
jgi:hypothetical protein